MSRPITRALLLLLWLLLAVLGLRGLWLRLTTGHELAAYGNYVPWGLWVAGYIYFIGLSAGAFVLSSVIYVGRVRLLAPLGPLALFAAVVTLVMALLSISMDLGHMNRALEVGLHANLRSMMAWMIFLYSAYFLVIATENVLAWVEAFGPFRDEPGLRGRLARLVTRIPERPATQLLHRLGLVGVPLAVAFHGGVGALFGTVGARPYWHQPLFPIMFLVGALVSGCGLLTVLYWAIWPRRDESFRLTVALLGKLVLALLLFDTLLEWAEFSIPLWQGISHEADIFKDVLFGTYWWNFWLVHLVLGVGLPLVLLATARGRSGRIALGSFLVAATFLSVRLNMVIPPLTQPLLEGLPGAFVSPRARFEYFPSGFEWMVSCGVLAVGGAMLWAGLRWLPLLPRGGDPGEAAQESA